ncbi:hypothetical protein O6H91_04G067400 [Diphasiastrum complanatum]|uniref:Uncharacterized protein n=1 Tax=Diphasiastrum complanatum TaxID=34168 RepID=A0ACC2DXS0_DIPCM|nr:hypothetical protein O6H91_04G067400 [Diphasiastrum complanatum]
MSKPWSGAGAWAADAERADAEAKDTAAAAAAFGPATEAFPTLGEAVSAKPQKKKKNQAISLSELVTGKYVGPGGGKTKQITDTNKLTPNEMMMLPTGPRDRSDEEPQYGGLGGGFKDYGGYRGGGGDRDHERGDRDRDGDRGYDERSRDRGFGGGFEREKAAAGYDGPSRADETDDWGATKKFVPSQGGGGYDDDRRGGRSSDRDLPSRADEVENWGSSKKFTPSNGFDRKSSGFGFDDTRRGYEEAPLRRSGGGYQEAPSRKSGYEEAPRRSGGFEDVPFRGLNSRADEAGDWGSTKKFVPSSAPLVNRGWDSGPDTDRWSRREQAQNGFSNVSERPRLVLQPRSRNVDDDESLLLKVKTLTDFADATQPKAKSNPFGAARPREDVLAEKGQDWRKIGSDLSTRDKDSRPSSSHSSRPATPDSSIDLPVKPRPRVNPFGNAKPREVLLQEKGKDWRKIDFELEHKSVDRFDVVQYVYITQFTLQNLVLFLQPRCNITLILYSFLLSRYTLI